MSNTLREKIQAKVDDMEGEIAILREQSKDLATRANELYALRMALNSLLRDTKSEPDAAVEAYDRGWHDFMKQIEDGVLALGKSLSLEPEFFDGDGTEASLVNSGLLAIAERLAPAGLIENEETGLFEKPMPLDGVMRVGDIVEFRSDLQASKGPSSGTVIWLDGDEVKIKHSDHEGELFLRSGLHVEKETHYRDGIQKLWLLA